MILTDSGPLLAILDRRDPYHEQCTATAQAFGDEPLLTTTPCFSEAMHMLGAAGGFRFQAQLWEMRKAGDLLLHEMTPGELDRAEVLMEKFHDSHGLWRRFSRRGRGDAGNARGIHARQAFLGLPSGRWIGTRSDSRPPILIRD